MAKGVKQRRFDWRVQFLRATEVDDGFSSVEQFVPYGDPVWAEKRDVSDSERIRSAEVAAQISSRFTVQWSGPTSTITAKDRILCDGLEFNIVGVRETGGRRRFLEISANARADR